MGKGTEMETETEKPGSTQDQSSAEREKRL
jgi:hypothetical protein